MAYSSRLPGKHLETILIATDTMQIKLNFIKHQIVISYNEQPYIHRDLYVHVAAEKQVNYRSDHETWL